MCDPISLGLMGVSAGVSAAGGALQNQATAKNNRNAAIAASQQNKENFDYNLADQERWGDYQRQINDANIKQIGYDTNAADAENAVRDAGVSQFTNAQGANDSTIAGLLSRFSAPAQSAAMGANAATRTAAIQGNETQPSAPTAAETGSGASPAIAAAFSNAANAGGAQSAAQAVGSGNYGAYGDTWTGNSGALTGANSAINSANNAANTYKEILPGEQQLAGFQQEKFIPTPFPKEAPPLPAPVYQAPQKTSGVGQALQGLGTLGGAIAGSGKAPGLVNGIGNLFARL